MNNPADLDKVKDEAPGAEAAAQDLLVLRGRVEQASARRGDFDVATYWSGSAARSKKDFEPAGGVRRCPKEGAIGWFDGLSIAAGAPEPRRRARQFIDFMVDPAFYVEWATEVGAPASANAKANALLPAKASKRDPWPIRGGERPIELHGAAERRRTRRRYQRAVGGR